MAEWTLLDSGETTWRYFPRYARKIIWARITDGDTTLSLVAPAIALTLRSKAAVVEEAFAALAFKLTDYGVDINA